MPDVVISPRSTPPPIPSGYLSLYFIPSNESELTKAGVILYLLGLFCTFIFFSQLNILSIDMLKPQCIVIGIYVWMWAVLLPRLWIQLVSLFRLKKRWLNILMVVLIFGGSDAIIFYELSAVHNILNPVLISLLAQLLFYFNIKKQAFELFPAATKNYLFMPVLAALFALILLPLIPQHLGGTKSEFVTVVFKEKQPDLLASRFIKGTGTYRFLYETDKDYYFLEKASDRKSGIVMRYVVKRIEKTEIVKLEFKTNPWVDF